MIAMIMMQVRLACNNILAMGRDGPGLAGGGDTLLLVNS